MEILCCALIGYLFGSVNPTYFASRIKGFDIRERGSGNAGASNAVIVFGKAFGAFCAVFDIAKAFFSAMICEALFPDFGYAFAVAGAACILGHIFSFFMRFRGGKGLACLGGIVLYFDWRVFLIMLAAELVIALLTDYICFVPTTGSVAFAAIYGILKKSVAGTFILLIPAAAIIWRHLGNFKKIREGKEMHFSYLWHKDAEMERMHRAYERPSDKND